MNESWSFHLLDNCLEIFVDCERVLLEHLLLEHTLENQHADEDSDKLIIEDKVGGQGVFGTLLLLGPRTYETREYIDSLYYKRQTFEEHVEHTTADRKCSRPEKSIRTETQSTQHSTSSSGSSSSSSSRSNSLATHVSVSHLHYGLSSNNTLHKAQCCTLSVVRFVAPTTEDAYGVLVRLLAPMEGELGLRPYADRLHAVFT